MKLRNATHYDTRALRRVLVAVHNDVATGSRGRLRTWRGLVVDVVHGRKHGYTGHAYRHGKLARLRLDKARCSVAHLAALWHHELLHLYGIRHADYPCVGNGRYWLPAERYSDLHARLGLPEHLEPCAPKPKPKPTIEDQRARLEARRRAWVTKQRRATTAIAKIDRALKRIEKKIGGQHGDGRNDDRAA